MVLRRLGKASIERVIEDVATEGECGFHIMLVLRRSLLSEQCGPFNAVGSAAKRDAFGRASNNPNVLIHANVFSLAMTCKIATCYTHEMTTMSGLREPGRVENVSSR